jgi:predicted amidophosphoribosyltransferase
MGGEKKAPLTSNIFANALSTTPKYVGADGSVSAGMHNNLACGHCGAAREKDDDGPLVCRYCGKPLQAKK